MTDQERKAMEMALEALELERTDSNGKKVDLVIPAIEALRQALAQGEQEPVEPPDYVEPITFDYHEGWEAGFKAGVEAKAKKQK